MIKRSVKFTTLIILIIVLAFAFWSGLSFRDYYNYIFKNAPSMSEAVYSTRGQLSVNSESWNVEIASTASQKENGLSNRQALRYREGMLFVFDKSDYQKFWMKDMLISLDIIFFDENWKIILIEKNLSAKTFPKTFGDTVKSKFVLEVNGGEASSAGLQVGDQAIFVNK